VSLQREHEEGWWGRAKRTYHYDHAGRRTARIEPSGAEYRFEYDSRGRLTAEIDPEENAYEYRYEENARGKLAAETNRLGNTKSYSYTPAGQIEQIEGFDGSLRELEYTPRGKTREERVDGAVVASYDYTPRGQISRAASPDTTLSYEYTQRGMISSVSDSSSGVTLHYGYNEAGMRTRIRDNLGQYEVRYHYGAAGEPRRIEIGSGAFRSREITISYDASLRESSRHFAGRYVAERSYTEAGRLAGVVYRRDSGMSAGNLLDAEAYVYNENGKRSYTVDEAGKITAYRYDEAGRLETALYPYGDEVIDSHLTQLKEAGLAPPLATAQEMPRSGPSELTGRMTVPHEEREAIREAVGTVLPNRKYSISFNQNIWGERFGYDRRGNRTSIQTPLGEIGYSYNAGNRQTQYGNVENHFDASGNLVRQVSGAGTLRFRYNAQDRISEVTGRKATGNRVSVRYGYDALGRRTSREARTRSGGGGDEAQSTAQHLVYDGRSVERVMTVENTSTFRAGPGERKSIQGGGGRSRFDQTNNSRSRGLTKSAAVNAATVRVGRDPVARIAQNRTTFYGTDVLGSVTVRMPGQPGHSAGNSGLGPDIEDLEYRAFGETTEGELTKKHPYGYTGKPVDPETGIYDYGFRDYAPQLARFTTVDPVKDGANWYAYVSNDPVNFVDPLGLEASDAQNAGNGIAGIPESENRIGDPITEVNPFAPDHFTGTVVRTSYASFSAGIEITSGSGYAYESESGTITRQTPVGTGGLGIDTNVGVEVGVMYDRYPGASTEDILGGSQYGEIEGSLYAGYSRGSDVSDSGAGSTTNTVSLGYGLSPVSASYSRQWTTEQREYESLRERRAWLSD
jgi:RHS repeat-associated protein